MSEPPYISRVVHPGHCVVERCRRPAMTLCEVHELRSHHLRNCGLCGVVFDIDAEDFLCPRCMHFHQTEANAVDDAWMRTQRRREAKLAVALVCFLVAAAVALVKICEMVGQ